MESVIRIGLIGAGANTKARHIPGFMAIPGVELAAVCNRRRESSEAVSAEFGIPRVFDHWEELATDPGIDAVVIGTWPYLHCPIAVAAFAAGKHVLTEARMAMNAGEARRMHAALAARPGLVGQIVPSPFGLRGERFVARLIADGYLGEIRECSVLGMNNVFGGPETPLHWRQDATLSGLNMLQLGILFESVSRWLPATVRVMAQAHAFIPERLDPASGIRRAVGTPDSVGVLAIHANGARTVYQLSGVSPAGEALSATIRGSRGMIHYDFLTDRVFGATTDSGSTTPAEPAELSVPKELEGGWSVEADFIRSIRTGAPVTHTSFDAGVAYMEFTEAVARSARDGVAVAIPA